MTINIQKACGWRHTELRATSKQRGAALIITLAFLVLLTVVVVAFFARAASERQISASSALQTRTDLLAQGGIDQIIGDLKQEIVDGSTPPNGTAIYVPTLPANMVPQLAGSTGNGGLENLVKRSASGVAFQSGSNASKRASNVNSATAPSKNYRYISPARWNKPLLMQATSATDTTPSLTGASFTAPDWVLMARNGQNPTSWDPSLITSRDNANTVLGRYAYNIYDEGGLLDVNVAGFPLSSNPPYTPTNSDPVAAYKSSVSFADLTQLPGISAMTVGKQKLIINSLVGWRNYASAQPGGGFASGYTFNAAQLANFTTWAVKNPVGFSRTANIALYNGQTDRLIASRQGLIRFLLQGVGSAIDTANLQTAMVYLTHFSRALEQPSFVPASGRPGIVGTSAPPANAASYQGNNTYYGGESAINMVGKGGFLSVRAGTTAFTRYDGSQSVAGEPLAKTRFPLSRLAWLTTEGPSASASASIKSALLAAGVAQATIDAGTAANIITCFGLAWNSASSSWTYNHSITSSGNPIIGKLSDVVTANREPDFAELLKAGINVGSVGKGSYTNQGNNYSYSLDVSGDRQILQIMANLIDQTKTDNYPTRIYPFNTNATTLPLIGIQDLPYFYNYHFFNVTTKLPQPLLSSSDQVDKAILEPGKTGTANHVKPLGTDTLQAGSASYMIIPEVWRPHDPNTPQTANGPTVFRVVAETTDPTGTLGYWQIKAAPEMNGQSFDGANDIAALKPPATAKSTPVLLDSNNGTLQFKDNTNGLAFREPTLLWRQNLPSGVTLTGTARTEDGSAQTNGKLAGKTYYGILVGDTNVSWQASANGVDYICQSSSMQRGTSVAGPAGCINDNMTFRMQFQNASGNWVTYQNAFVEATLQDIPAYALFVNTADWAKQEYDNPLQSFGGGSALTVPRGGPNDPRSSRFSSTVRGFFDQDDPALNDNPTLDAVTMKSVSGGNPSAGNLSAAENQAVADSNFVMIKTQRPTTSRGQFYNWTNPSGPYSAQQGFYSAANYNTGGNMGGLFSQNSPSVKLTSGVTNYYEDADGICRRAIGGYTPVVGTPTGRQTNTSSTVGLPMVTASAGFSGGIGSATSQSQSRPIILHRPFRNVAEMSYAFRGTPWKNIDFFTPESGDSALLDVFCINEPPSDGIVAGKVNLNTRQPQVLRSILTSAYRDEWDSLSTKPPSGTVASISNTEATTIANKLTNITSNATNAWQGPLTNISDLVGHYIPSASGASGTDVYNYASPAGGSYTFAGLSAALGDSGPSSLWSTNIPQSANIQRMHEAPIRALAATGQTRVWNLLIDVVAQSGRYPSSAKTLPDFLVEGEKRYWVHVAIDRITGQVIDKQVELVAE